MRENVGCVHDVPGGRDMGNAQKLDPLNVADYCDTHGAGG
jgi:hypothetical protein